MKRFKNILLAINSNAKPDPAFNRAVTLATHNQAKLTVIEVLEDFANFHHLLSRIHTNEIMKNVVQERTMVLEEMTASVGQEIEVEIKVVCGKTFLEIIRAVLQNQHDLVIKTAEENYNLKTMIFGSMDMHLLRKCPCPVWIIKPEDGRKYLRILAAVDIQPSPDDSKMDSLNDQISEISMSLAFSELSELFIVHAWLVFGESIARSSWSKYQRDEVVSWIAAQKEDIKERQKQFKEKIDQLLGEKGKDYLRPEICLVEGDATEVIPQVAEEKKADLVIMGTVGRTGLPGFFMGNTAESILSRLNCSVLAIKPEGFISTVTLA